MSNVRGFIAFEGIVKYNEIRTHEKFQEHNAEYDEHNQV